MPQRFNGSWNATYPDQNQYTGHIRIEVRQNVIHMITGDVFLNGVYDGWWEASNVNLAGNRLTFQYSILSTNSQTYGGSLDLTMQNANSITGRFADDNGGDQGRLNLSKIGNEYRQITAEVDALSGIAWLPQVNHNGRTWDLRDIYTNAGIDLTVNNNDNNLTDPGTPLSDADIHAIMVDERVQGQGPPWWGYLLLATTSTRGSLGVMFDQQGNHREGAAVFFNAFANINGVNNDQERDRAILRTAAHELGHALNLLHPGVADRGTNIMNQTGVLQNLPNWPDNIDYTFRGINAEHLRHHRHPAVSFGGDNFGSDPHDIHGDNNSNLAHAVDKRIKVSLSSDQKVLQFAEPWYFRISVRNVSTNEIKVDKRLELGAGRVLLSVRRPDGKTTVIHPSVIHDFAVDMQSLGHSESITHDSVLLVDRSGPVFNQPGTYQVQAAFSGVEKTPWCVAVSDVFEIRVLYPTRNEEMALLKLEKYETRMFFELDGADHLLEHVKELKEICATEDLEPLHSHLELVDAVRLSRPFHDVCGDSSREADESAGETMRKIRKRVGKNSQKSRFIRACED